MGIHLQASGRVAEASRTPDGGTPRQTFETISAGRGIAALLVVLFHVNKLVANPAYWGTRVFGGAFACGHAGVEFFFVLSGFIIAHVHASDIGQPARLGRYVARRFDRIIPLYWLILTVMTAIAYIVPNVASLRHVDLESIAASYILVGPDNHAGVLTVSWTLFHEMLFYAAFALAIVDRRAGIAAGATWLALIGAAAVTGLPRVPAYFVSPLNLLFIAGALSQVAVRRHWVRYPLAWASVGIAAFFALATEEVVHPLFPEVARNLLYGVTSAITLAGIVSFERDRPVVVPRALLVLGAASYSIYLVHFPALSAVAVIMRRAGLIAALPVPIGVAVLSATVVAMGVATHMLIEQPLLDRLRIRAATARNLSSLSASPG